MATRKFEHGSELTEAQDKYGTREVGITHPDVPGFVRIRDNGDVEIVAGEGLSITMNPKSNSITFVADSIKFITKDDGLKWNNQRFNSSARQYSEPTLTDIEEDEINTLYRDVDYFLDDSMTTFGGGVDDISELRLEEEEQQEPEREEFIEGIVEQGISIDFEELDD